MLLFLKQMVFWRDTCVSSTQLNWAIWKRYDFCQLENSDIQEIFLSKSNSILTVNNAPDAAA
jgi:hypothetical protein